MACDTDVFTENVGGNTTEFQYRVTTDSDIFTLLPTGAWQARRKRALKSEALNVTVNLSLIVL